jgi:hypothetical protein
MGGNKDISLKSIPFASSMVGNIIVLAHQTL